MKSSTKSDWKPVKKATPCPKCGGADRCSTSGDATFCFRVPSDRPAKNGGPGWLHLPKRKGDAGEGDRPSFSKPWEPGDPTGTPKPKPVTAGGKRGIFASIDEAVAAAVASTYGTEDGVYRYIDPTNGRLLQVVARIRTDDGKVCLPIAPWKGGYRLKAAQGKLPPYRIGDVAPEGVVVVAEGEAKADALLDLGLSAVTSVGGADRAPGTNWGGLAGRSVVIWPDNDEAGEKYRREVSRILLGLGCEVASIDPAAAGCGPGEDCVDAIARMRADGLDDEAVAGRVSELVAGATRILAEDVGAAAVSVRLDEVKPEATRWLWAGRWPMGKLSLAAGLGGVGKSTALRDTGARVTVGAEWPDGSGWAPMGSVLIVAGEDSAADVIVPGIEAAGGDLRKVHLLTHVKLDDGTERGLTYADVELVARKIKSIGDVRLVILDPHGEMLGQTKGNDDAEVRTALRPWRAMAESTGVAVVVIAHLKKGAEDAAALKVGGSVGLVNAVRVAWMFARDPGNPDAGLMVLMKSNLKCAKGLSYRLVDAGGVARVAWGGAVDVVADDLMKLEGDRPGPEPEAQNAAAEWLSELLKAGPVPSGDPKKPEPGTVAAEAKAAGIAWGTLRRAKDSLGVRSERNSFTGGWEWRLPKLAPNNDSRGLSEQLEHLEHLGVIESETGVRDDDTAQGAQVAFQDARVVEVGEGELEHLGRDDVGEPPLLSEKRQDAQDAQVAHISPQTDVQPPPAIEPDALELFAAFEDAVLSMDPGERGRR